VTIARELEMHARLRHAGTRSAGAATSVNARASSIDDRWVRFAPAW
jgi:hypothetical protein